MRLRGFRGIAATAVVCLGLTTAACGSSTGDAGTGNAGTSDTASLLGPEKKATGTPVKIGFVSDGKSAAIDLSQDVPAAQAAATYVNEHLGGIGGHPIQLVVCETHSTPSGASDCGSQMVDNHVSAVLINASAQAGTVFKPVNAAGIPFVADAVADGTVIRGTNSYVLPNTLYIFAGPPKMAQQAQAKRAAVIAINVPNTSQGVRTLEAGFYQKAGVPFDIVSVAPDAADMTPQVQGELTKNPDQIQVIGGPAFCTAALKAMKTLGYDKETVIIEQCVDPSGKSGIPGGYAGMKMVGSKDTDPSSAAYKLYLAVMKQYAPNTLPDNITTGGYSAVVGFARAMSGVTGELTPASVKDAFATMQPQPYPLGSYTFQCNGKQIPSAPAICSTSVLTTTLDSAGKPKGGFQALDVSDLVK